MIAWKSPVKCRLMRSVGIDLARAAAGRAALHAEARARARARAAPGRPTRRAAQSAWARPMRRGRLALAGRRRRDRRDEDQARRGGGAALVRGPRGRPWRCRVRRGGGPPRSRPSVVAISAIGRGVTERAISMSVGIVPPRRSPPCARPGRERSRAKGRSRRPPRAYRTRRGADGGASPETRLAASGSKAAASGGRSKRAPARRARDDPVRCVAFGLAVGAVRASGLPRLATRARGRGSDGGGLCSVMCRSSGDSEA